MIRSLLAFTACMALGLVSVPARAADVTAEQSALLYDLIDPVIKDPSLANGTDAGILQRALSSLKEQGLAGQGGRPNFQEQGILERYGRALFLGARTKEFAPDIGRIRDIVSSGDRPALEKALTDLWTKAGRAPPEKKALEPVIQSLYGAKGQEPEETVRHVFDGPARRIEVVHARAGGLMQVEVAAKDKGGNATERTVLQGLTETKPQGQDLQRRIRLEKSCTSTEDTDEDADLEGRWKSASGQEWTVEHDGNKVTLVEQRANLPPLTYTGTYSLGKISAIHPITAVTDMEASLPMDVRSQLTKMGISFRISLEFCASSDGKMNGTWSSQHVTYDGMTHSVEKIHDPYDLQLTLTRGGAEKTAEGASEKELL